MIPGGMKSVGSNPGGIISVGTNPVDMPLTKNLPTGFLPTGIVPTDFMPPGIIPVEFQLNVLSQHLLNIVFVLVQYLMIPCMNSHEILNGDRIQCNKHLYKILHDSDLF